MKNLYLLCKNDVISKKITPILKKLEKTLRISFLFLKKETLYKTNIKENFVLLTSQKDYESLAKFFKRKELTKKFPNIAILSEERSTLKIAEFSLHPICDYILVNKKTSEIFLQLKNLVTKKEEAKLPKTNFLAGETLEKIRIKLKKVLKSQIKSVLVTGESGTGKELIASCLENLLEKNTPFYKLNCASLSSELLESELFGHEKGAFTGAHAKKEGLLSHANHGWVFLDEVACLPPKAQSSLLRFLETGEVRPVGEARSFFLDIKVIAATNESLFSLVHKGLFRRDLLERLRIYEIEIPPLRERSQKEKEEILDHLIEKISLQNKELSFTASEELRLILLAYNWKNGNIREMKNILSTVFVNKNSNLGGVCDLPKSFLKKILENERQEKKVLREDPKKNLEALKNTWFLKNLDLATEKEPGRKINKARLAKHLEISPWKVSNYLKSVKENELLPSKYFYLLE